MKDPEEEMADTSKDRLKRYTERDDREMRREIRKILMERWQITAEMSSRCMIEHAFDKV